MSWRWLVEAGWEMHVSTPPRLVARRHSATRSMTASPPGRPPSTSKLMQAAEAVEDAARNRMGRVRGQARVEHAAHTRVPVQELGDRGGVGRCPLEPQVQRADSAPHQPGGVGGERRAEVERALGEPRDQVGRPRRDAREHVGVAVQVLGRGVEDEVGPVLERAAVDRRGDGVVDHEPRARRVGDLGHRRDVGDGQVRVRDRLDDDQGGALHRLAQRVGIADVDQPAVGPRAEAMWWVWP